MIESILIISVFLNIVLISCIYLSDDTTGLKVENKKLEMENIILQRETNKMKDLFHYLIDEDVRIEKADNEAVIIYKKQEDNLKEILEEGLGIK